MGYQITSRLWRIRTNERAFCMLPPNRTLTTGWVVFWTEEGEREADNHVDKLPCHRRHSHFHFQSTILTTTRNVPLPSPDTLSMNARQMKGWMGLSPDWIWGFSWRSFALIGWYLFREMLPPEDILIYNSNRIRKQQSQKIASVNLSYPTLPPVDSFNLLLPNSSSSLVWSANRVNWSLLPFDISLSFPWLFTSCRGRTLR